MKRSLVALAFAAFCSSASAQSRDARTQRDFLELGAGCSELVATASESTPLELRLFERGGTLVSGPVTGVSSVSTRYCSPRAEELVAITRLDGSARVTLRAIEASSSSSAGAASTRDEPGLRSSPGSSSVSTSAAGTTSPRATAAPYRASAPARVSARVAELVGQGLEARRDLVAEMLSNDRPLRLPLPGSSCTLFIVAADGGELEMLGHRVADGSEATFFVCPGQIQALELETSAGPIRVAHAFVGRDLDPRGLVRSLQLAWAKARALRATRELDLLVDRDRVILLPFRVEAGRCVAALVAADARITLTLLDEDGVVVGSSSSRSPAPRIMRCANERAFSFTLDIRGNATRVPLLIVESVGP